MQPAHWNMIVYAIAGDADEHKRITDAIGQMHKALTTDQCNIAVQVHAASQTTRYWLAAGRDVRTQVLPKIVDASRPATLTDFLNEANRAFPAASSALVLWAHGSGLDHVHNYPAKASAAGHGGAAGEHASPGLGGGLGHGASLGHRAALGHAGRLGRGAALGNGAFLGHGGRCQPPPRKPEPYGCRWGPDPVTHQFLTNVAMKQAIAASGRGHVDVLALNACWMAALEVEYELRNVAAVEVASQVYARPWPYGAIIASLSATPAQSADQLARTIVATVQSEIALGKRDDAVSAVRAGAAMDELAAAFEMYARRVTALIDADWPSVQQAVMTDAQRIDDPYQVDLASLIRVLGNNDPEARAAAAVVATRLESMLVASAAHASHPGVHGLSVFCPKSTHVDLFDAYQGTEFRTHSWAKFLVEFQRRSGRS
jgi:hypothetical protein